MGREDERGAADIKAAVEQARAQGCSSLHPLEAANWKTRYGALLAQGYQANLLDPPPEIGKKGRCKQSVARNLLDLLSKHQEVMLMFMDSFAVSFDGRPGQARITDGQNIARGLRHFPLGRRHSGFLSHPRLPCNVGSKAWLC